MIGNGRLRRRAPLALAPAAGAFFTNGALLVGLALSASLGFGSTDAQRKFKLRASDGDNVALGDYQVTVTKKEFTPPPPSEQDYVPPAEDAPAAPEPKDLLPAKYKTVKDTPLKATVTADGKNDFPFDLAD